MKLATPFCRLPLRFDAGRLREEVEAFGDAEWRRHPSGYAGNSAIRLISADGEENDRVGGAMWPTANLARCPYIRQILSQFGVVWSRSRLMRLDPHSVVPEHSDVNYYWFTRVRLHIPIRTHPDVSFHCGEQSVHMAAGDGWIFDNWRLHRVVNASDQTRIHLVADTVGTSAFWNLVARGDADVPGGRRPNQSPLVPYRDGGPASTLLTERYNTPQVMVPAEVEALVADLCGDLAAPERDGATSIRRFHLLCLGFVHEWRALWSLHGDEAAGRDTYRQLCERVGSSAGSLGASLVMASNGMSAIDVLKARILDHAVQPAAVAGSDMEEDAADEYAAAPRRPGSGPRRAPRARQVLRPVFIVAAPRSGSTLLFETLACTPQLWTLGGEAHWLVENIADLQPGASGIDSNRLGAEHASAEVAALIREQLSLYLRDTRGGSPDSAGGDATIRFLEKTPKNSLRIPFFDRLFPDAQFIFLWRDPRENIASIIEAWQSGAWITYPQLSDWDGPWSLLLPPEWRALRGKPFADIAAFQWECSNRIILDDLARMAPERWCVVEYSNLVRDPTATVRRLCDFAGIRFDEALAQRVSATPLPLSRSTHTPPEPGKWRRHAADIERLMDALTPTLQRLVAHALDS